MAITFKYITLYVEDVTRSITFYENAFGLARLFIHDSGDYGELQTGDTVLSFASRDLITQLDKNPGKVEDGATTFEIAFETNDVPGALATALQAGATLAHDIKEETWGQTTAYITDPDGHLVAVCSPVMHTENNEET